MLRWEETNQKARLLIFDEVEYLMDNASILD